ncbi:MAG: apolipoprotein N-acyltransferase [Candidatus Omnitrophica bacterium]|nr:apolipoprotein N-acyltransferase [Candidatus Omnitrophota bacterium]
MAAPRCAFRRSRPIAGALTSALLLILAFPNFGQPWCAWMALVPWLHLVRACTPGAAFRWSYGIGLIFFLVSLWWLIHVTVVGWLVLCAYLALFFGLFGLFASRLIPCHLSPVICPLFLPSAWVALEYARSHLLSGFGWNLLAYSQTSWTPLIQLADLTGAWGVSFLIVLGNVALAQWCDSTHARRERLLGVLVVTGCLGAALGYGAWRIPRVMGTQTTRVAVVQGNIPQEEKWDEAYRESILQRYDVLTHEAAKTHPQLIVWPETAVPGYVGLEESVTRRVETLARALGIPMLVGSPIGRLSAGATWQMTNSAALLDSGGLSTQRYDKLRLVPFGEFIPGERWCPWLRSLLPPIGDFVPGAEHTVFRLPVSSSEFRVAGSDSNSPLAFSVLICFEDIFPELARRFVLDGARFLLVITNDAWFGPTAAAYQHVQASTFRAIELRVPIARAANTGWSGCIDPAGRWNDWVHDVQGAELFVAGTRTCELPWGTARTLYLQWGDWFAILCLAITVGWGVLSMVKRRRT